MNGRGYDYQLGRFLSVDPFIQAPGNSQSFNPYSYLMNNPLAGTDPTGYVGEPGHAGQFLAETFLVGIGSRTVEEAELIADAEAASPFGNQGMHGAGETGEIISQAFESGSIITAVAIAAQKSAGRLKSKKRNRRQNSSNNPSNGKADGQGTSPNNVSEPSKTGEQAKRENVKSTSELRGKGNFKEGKMDADKRSPKTCEFCGGTAEKPEGDHFIPLKEGKNAVNRGEMTKQEAIDKLDSKENFVNSCKGCNRGVDGKHGKTPSSTDGPGKFKIDRSKASSFVNQKLDELEKLEEN